MAEITSDAVLFDSDGNILSGTTLSRATITNGGVANSTTVNYGGDMYISSGGVANSTTVNYGGSMYISSGGVANNTTVNDGGCMSICSGGSALSVKENGGCVHLAEGAYVTFLPNTIQGLTKEGVMTVHSNTIAVSTTLNTGGQMYIYSGGMANSTIVNFAGMFIYSGGSADTTILNSWGQMHISSGGVADNTTVYGSMYVSSGGTAYSTTVNSGGSIIIARGGSADIAFDPWQSGVVSQAGANVTYYNDAKVYYGDRYSGLISKYDSVSCLAVRCSAIVYSGGAVNDAVIDYGSMYINSGGIANGTVVSGGDFFLSSGGSANKTLIDQYGEMYVSSAACATGTVISGYSATMYVSSGGTASNTIFSWGSMSVDSGGSADGVIVRMDTVSGSSSRSGYINVASGGIVNNVLVESNGILYLSGCARDVVVQGRLTGGSASNVTVESGGKISGYLTSAIIKSGAQAYISGANETRLYGAMTVASSGSADDTTIEHSGVMYIHSRGTAENTTVLSGGTMHVSGTANETTVSSGGYIFFDYSKASSHRNLTLLKGGIIGGCFTYAEDKHWNAFASGIIEENVFVSSGNIYITSGGTAHNMVIHSRGVIWVNSGGSADNIIIDNGSIIVENGGMAYNTTVNESGNLNIYRGGAGSGTVIHSGGKINFASGGSAVDTVILSGGSVTFSSGGLLSNTVIESGGTIVLSSGGGAIQTTISSGGTLTIKRFTHISGITAHSGATVNVIDNGFLHIYGSDTLNDAQVSDYGFLTVMADGCVSDTLISQNGHLRISGIADNSQLYDGSMDIFSGGSACNTMINSRGVLYICGGTAVSTTVAAGGSIVVSSGTLCDTTVQQGGIICIDSCGVMQLEGELKLQAGAIVSADRYSSIDFVLKNRTTEDTYLINDLSLIQGAPTYTITVSADQADGCYKLAQGASSFTGTITIGTETETYGTLTVNEAALIYNGKQYSLKLNGENLQLFVSPPDSEAPILEITGNATAWTNKNVVLTADASDSPSGLASIEYSLDNINWTEGESVTVSENGMVYFRATNKAGNVTVKNVVVDKIDKTAPVRGKITLKQTDQNSVKVTISGFTDNVKIARYDVYVSGKKVGSTTGTTYTYKSGANLTAGAKSFAVKAVDTAGNISTSASAKLTVNLAVVGKATSKSTVLTWKAASVSGGLKQYEVVVSGKKYISTTNKITLSGLAVGSRSVTVYARSKTNKLTTLDTGDIIKVTDGTAPTGGKVVAAQSGQKNINVTLSGFKDNVKVAKYYVYVNGTKVATTTSTSYTYKSSMNLIGKKTVMVKALDAAGNVSAGKSVAITIKDVTAPSKVTGLKVSGTPTQASAKLVWTKGVDNVGVTKYAVKVSGVTKLYTTTTNALTVKGLTAGTHTYQVYAYDATGRKSVVSTAYSFNVKDITKPTGGKITLKQASQNSVKITISSFKDNVKVGKYYVYLNGKKIATTTSTTYTYTQSANFTTSKLTFAVKAVDTTGNVSVSKSAAFAAKVRVSGKATNLSTVLTWTKPAISGTLKRYEITVSGKKYTSTTNKITIKGLAIGTRSVTIKAINTSNQSKTVCSGELIKVVAATVNKTISGITNGVKDVNGITGSAANDIVTFLKDRDFNLLSDISLGSGDDKLIIPDWTYCDAEPGTVEGMGVDIFYPGIAFENSAGIDFGAGNDTLDLGSYVCLGYSDRMVAEGFSWEDLVAGTLNFGTGNDMFRMREVSECSAKSISFGDGNDTLQLDYNAWLDLNEGDGKILFGAGNDKLILDDSSELEASNTLTLDFGSGTDTMTFNGDVEVYADQLVITGLENITGSGSLVLSYGCTLDDETKAKFEQAGITVTLA